MTLGRCRYSMASGNAPCALNYGLSIAMFLMQAATLLRLTYCDGGTYDSGLYIQTFMELEGLCVDEHRISLSPAS